MKRIIWLLAILIHCAAPGGLRAQGLAEILTSINERHQLLKQKWQVGTALSNLNADPVRPEAEEVATALLWDCLGTGNYFPQESDLTGLGMGARIELLNKAIEEFRSLRGSFFNVSPGKLGGSAPIGTVRPFLPGDFSPYPRVTPMNYHAVERQLALDLLKLRVTNWKCYAFSATTEADYVQEQKIENDEIVSDTKRNGVETSEIGWAPTSISLENESQAPSSVGSMEKFSDTLSAWGCFKQTSDELDGETVWLDYVNYGASLFYASSIKLKAKVSGVANQVSGNVVLLRRTGWSPASTVTWPWSASPTAGGYQIAGATTTSATVTSSFPTVAVTGTWENSEAVDGPSNEFKKGFKKFVPAGFNAYSGYLAGTGSLDTNYDSLYVAADVGTVDVWQRSYQCLMVADFSLGLDNGPQNLAGLEQTPASTSIGLLQSLPPAAPPDGEPVLRPVPEILVGIPLGAGLDDPAATGWLGVTPCFRSAMSSSRLGADWGELWGNTWVGNPQFGRYDYVSALRLIGPASEFHVVYETGRDQGDRSGSPPDWTLNAQGAESSGWFEKENVLCAWESSRVKQVVSRQLLLDVSWTDEYTQTVKVYRRIDGGPTINRATNTIVPIANLPLVRTLTFTLPGHTGSSIPSSPEHLKITDDQGAVSEVIRSATGYTAPAEGELFSNGGFSNGTWTYRISKENGPVFRESVYDYIEVYDSYTGTLDLENSRLSVGLTVDDRNAGSAELYGVANPFDHWHPSQQIFTTAEDETITTTYTASYSELSQDGVYPERIQVTFGNGRDLPVDLKWTTKGLPDYASRGPWLIDYTVDPGTPSLLEIESKYVGDTYGIDWIEWVNGPGQAILYSAPDGGVSGKGDASVTQTTVYRQGLGGGAGTIPWAVQKTTERDGTGSFHTWTIDANGAELQIDTGVLNAGGSAVTRGSRHEVRHSPFGFPAYNRTSVLSGTNALVVAGTTWPTDPSSPEVTNWGAPKSRTDIATGLGSSWDFQSHMGARLSEFTDALGNTAGIVARDDIGRTTSYRWNSQTANGSVQYNNGAFNTRASITLDGVERASESETDSAGRRIRGTVTGTRAFEWRRVLAQETASSLKFVLEDTTHGAIGSGGDKVHDLTVSRADGTTASAAGDEIPFDGLAEDPLLVVNGLLVTNRALAGQPGAYEKVSVDAWGRVRTVERPTTETNGATPDTTDYLYSPATSQIQRVRINHASGRRMIHETNPATGTTRSGFDIDTNGSLDPGTDRYAESATSTTASEVATTVTVTGQGELLGRVYTPATGDLVLSCNEGEEIITVDPDYAAGSIDTTSDRGWSQTTAITNLGAAGVTTLNGVGIPETTLTPVFWEDGSPRQLSFRIGPELNPDTTASVSFGLDGLLTAYVDPVLGSVPVTHSVANGKEALSINGSQQAVSFDGTSIETSGEGVHEHSVSITVPETAQQGESFVKTYDPTGDGSSTGILIGAAGQQEKHAYASGHQPAYEWFAGGLFKSKTLGRGGAISFGYTADGARNPQYMVFPYVDPDSGSYRTVGTNDTPTSVGDSAGKVEWSYNAANLVDGIQDASGARTIGWVKGRPELETYTSGALAGWKIDRQFGTDGLPDGVEVSLDETPLHSWTIQQTESGGEVSSEIESIDDGGFSAVFRRDPVSRRITRIVRGSLVQVIDRGNGGRITGVSAGILSVPGDPDSTVIPLDDAPGFVYADPNHDAKGRRTVVTTKRGATVRGTWTYGYRGGATGDGQLVSAQHSNSDIGAFTYTVDDIGRRTSYSVPGSGTLTATANGSDPLNQFTQAQRFQQVDLLISAHPDSRVWLNGSEIPPYPGDFDGFIRQPITGSGWTSWSILAKRTGGGEPGAAPDRSAESNGYVWLPPATENYVYDDDGNRESTALWTYKYDGLNRLMRATSADLATAPRGWDVSFSYDSEGRRFKKVATRYINGNLASKTTTTFVWNGWDLAYEKQQQDVNGPTIFEREYVWGPDISGEVDGAGGAGGLLLIREIRGQTPKEYHPIYDGAGHVVGLVDEANTVVAEYWWGPFGELIEAKGEMAQVNPGATRPSTSIPKPDSTTSATATTTRCPASGSAGRSLVRMNR